MGIVEDALQAVGLRQVGGLAQQAKRFFAAAVEHEGAQAQQLDVQAPLLQVLRQRIGARQRFERTAPVLRRNGGVAEGQFAQHLNAAAPQPAARTAGQQRIDLRAQIAAGFRAEAARMQPHLIGQAGHAQARQTGAPRPPHAARPASSSARCLGVFGHRGLRAIVR